MSMQHFSPSPKAQELIQNARVGHGSQQGLITVDKSGPGFSVTAGGTAFEPSDEVIQAVQELFEQGWIALISEPEGEFRHYQLTPTGYAQSLGVAP